MRYWQERRRIVSIENMSLEREFVRVAIGDLEQCCERIETCVRKLTPEQVWGRGAEHQNAVGNLLLHLTGNVRQWILSGIGGAQDTRVRDQEFAERRRIDPAELVGRLRTTVEEAGEAIRHLSADQ